ncbi:SPOR domain-containing protein [Hyphomicrobium sp. LHD-15]|uniref:SPOR domain-containing protein n=1 Tax=Hyphomicrobium sp. LHD-15 TaxID=3072142 RepID=UPI00280D2581|nr:SPOR domain-containing protein [Hyphomicrobium sp. LHD-15]MDQ8700075.1 SPOR domain-containing protein [Hyphomicrobium sp. LHD-15]
MAAFDRDSALERQQIHEISINVARRLLRLLERSRNTPPHVAADIGSGARVISDVQREIEQLMASLPAHGPLDIAVLTHILGSHRRALDMLEVLEARLTQAVGPDETRSDAARAHSALLATSREIERDAQRYAQSYPESYPQSYPLPSPGGARAPLALTGPANMPGPYPPQPGAPQRQGAQRPPAQQPPPPAHGFGRRPEPPLTKKRRAGNAPKLPTLSEVRALLTDRKVTAAFAVMTVVAGLAVSVLSFIGGGDAKHAALEPGQKLDGRLDDAAPETGSLAPSGGSMSAEAAPATAALGPVTDPLMEQPYLVVLATRQTTEELHQDFRSLKGSYPDILGTAKARVDRVQGQDRQNWYRLSLIPPQSRDDAKAVCSSLRSAGMVGCWIRPLPLGRPQH